MQNGVSFRPYIDIVASRYVKLNYRAPNSLGYLAHLHVSLSDDENKGSYGTTHPTLNDDSTYLTRPIISPFLYSNKSIRYLQYKPHSRNFSTSSFVFDENKSFAHSGLAKAEDCDAVLARHADIKSRLDRLKKPSSIRTWDGIVKNAIKGLYNGGIWTTKFVFNFPKHVKDFFSVPTGQWKKKMTGIWSSIKHEGHHYWVGTKLLAYEVHLATGYAVKAAKGDVLTRRERRQLTRTTADLFRLVPMVVIVVIPFLELSLPILLRIFPNMLPSTYEDKTKKEEELRRRLNVKLELANFLQDTVAEMAKDIKERSTGDKARFAQGLNDFLSKVRSGLPVENHEIINFAQLFNNDITLDNLERVQLVSMCQFVGISPFGTDQFLRSRLRTHLQKIKQDDYEIEQEGIENLTADELRIACRARGMRAPYGEGSVPFMTRNLRDWLDLSLHRGLPSSLLLLSRAFTITASAVTDVVTKKEMAYSKLKDTLGVLNDEVVESVELEASGGSSSDVLSLTKKLEYLKREEEIIRQEAKAGKASVVSGSQGLETPQHIGLGAVPGFNIDGSSSTTTAAPSIKPDTMKQGLDAADMASGGMTTEGAPADASRGSKPLPSVTLSSQPVLNEDERLVLLRHERENKVKSLAVGLINLASGDGVACERQYFMELVNKEINSINKTLAKQAAVRSFLFSGKGLEIKSSSQPQTDSSSAGAQSDSTERVTAHVTKLLHSIEHELDSMGSEIGNRMHVLDVDNDGVVTTDELEKALGYIRTQLDPEDMQLLYSLLGAAAARQPEEKVGNSIAVGNLLTIAKGPAHYDGSSKGSAAMESVQIHIK